MSTMSGPQRSSQRRPPTADLPMPPMGQQAVGPANAAPRSSSGSAKSGKSTTQPEKQISQIEKSVTHLLVATKQLLETLTQWSRGQATEGEVSDVYVRLGYEFNLACRAFSSIGVETNDLGPVPDMLRAILEDTLSQEASPQSLDQYLPKIRDIIINLLQGLKRKQAKLRSRPNREARQGSGSALPSRQASGGSLAGAEAEKQLMDQMPEQEPRRQPDERYENTVVRDDQNTTSRATPVPMPEIPVQNERDMRRESRVLQSSGSSSSMSSNTMQNIPVVSPYPEMQNNGIPADFPPPPPPPKQQDALAALQRGGDLERRASRRFSQYQISKHLGASPSGMTVLPASQNSPIPNRGRDLRESMNAVRSRGSFRQSRPKSNSRMGEPSPNRQIQTSDTITEEDSTARPTPTISPPDEVRADDSPMAKTPDDKYGSALTEPTSADGPGPAMSATINGPLPSLPAPVDEASPVDGEPDKKIDLQPSDDSSHKTAPSQQDVAAVNIETPPQSRQFTPEESPPPGKELTLFLQYKSKINKFVLPEGYNELTTARLQLAFIEKFAWNTHNNGVDLPEIYIQDPISGVRHELEDLSDVKDRCVLVLNIEALDEVKKHIDDGLGGIRQLVEGVRGTLEGQEALMQRFADRQLETAKDMARMAAAPPSTPAVTNAAVTKSVVQPSGRAPIASAATLTEVQSLRREIAVLRQSYSTMASDFTASLQNIKAKGASVKKMAESAAIPTMAGNAGRVHVESGRKQLQGESETLVNRVDDLSDLVEDLRKDVVTRGVRPMPRQLEDVSKDISATVKELTKVKDFLKREKPIWTKIWEKELDLVCQERDELTQQEELMADLTGDIEDLSDIFKLVEEATKQQHLQSNGGSGGRIASRNLPIDPSADPLKSRDGVLGEVRALNPNHEDRLEAIERAEKLRKRELETRKGGEFQREVESFVGEGKLKKTGGAEEVERLRKIKDERVLTETWNFINGIRAKMEDEEKQESLETAANQPLPESGSTDFESSLSAEGLGENIAPMTSRESGDKFEEAHEEPSDDKDGEPGTPASPTTPSKRTSSWLPSIFSG